MRKLILLGLLLLTQTAFSQSIKCNLVGSGTSPYGMYTFMPSLSFSHDSRYLAYGTDVGKVQIVDVQNYSSKNNYVDLTVDSPSKIIACAFHPGKSILAIGCMDGSLTIYDYAEKKKIKFIPTAHAKGLTTASWSGDTLYTGGYEQSINTWDINGELIKTYPTSSKPHGIFVRGNKIIYNNQKQGKSIGIINRTTGEEHILATSGAVRMSVTKDGKTAYLSTYNYGIHVWDLVTEKQTGTFKDTEAKGAYYGMDVSVDGTLMICGGLGKHFSIHSTNPQNMIYNTAAKILYECRISPDNRFVAIVDGSYIYVYHLSKDGKYIQTIKDEAGGVYTGNYSIGSGKREDDAATYVWPDGRKFVGSYVNDVMTAGVIYYPDGRTENFGKTNVKESIDLAFYVRITEKEGMGSYVKRDEIVFTRVFNIPSDATPESVLQVSKSIAEAQLEGKDYVFITHQKPEKGEDYETFKKRLSSKDNLPWRGASGNYADFVK